MDRAEKAFLLALTSQNFSGWQDRGESPQQNETHGRVGVEGDGFSNIPVPNHLMLYRSKSAL